MYRANIPTHLNLRGQRLESFDNLKQKTRPVLSTDGHIPGCGIPLTVGKAANEYLTAAEELHSFVIGETGSGKTRRVVMPAICLLGKTGESMILTDPKGELYRNTAEDLKEKGYSVHVINFRDPETGSGWNPLGRIESFYRSGAGQDRISALNELDDIMDSITANVGKGSSDNAYWYLAAKNILTAICGVILDYGEPGTLTFGNISAFFKELNDIPPVGNSQRRTCRNPLLKWIENLPEGSPYRDGLTLFTDAPERTRASHYSCVMSSLTPFTNKPALTDMMSATDFDLAGFGKRSTALYIILPDESEANYFLATLLIGQIYRELLRLADSQTDGRLPVRVDFILDEFANFPKISGMSSMLTASRSRGITFTLVCQSMEQLYSKYTLNDAETLMANCRIWIYMNCRNLAFLNRISELAGKAVIGTGSGWNQVPLFSVSELTHLNQGEVIIFNDRCNPYRGYLPDIEEYNFGKGHVNRPARPGRRRGSKAKRFQTIVLYPAAEDDSSDSFILDDII